MKGEGKKRLTAQRKLELYLETRQKDANLGEILDGTACTSMIYGELRQSLNGRRLKLSRFVATGMALPRRALASTMRWWRNWRAKSRRSANSRWSTPY